MGNIQAVSAVIFAGGIGSRLRDVVSDRSKVLAEVNGQPFVYYLFDQLCRAGIRRVTLCTGYLGEHLEQMIGNRYETIDIDYSREKAPRGTGGALRHAAAMIKEESILVMNGDSFTDIDIQDFFYWHVKKRGRLSIVIATVKESDRFDVVEMSADGRIIGFSERRSAISDSPILINAGIYLMHRSVIDSLPVKKRFSLEREFFPRFVEKEILGYRTNAAFIDIGTPDSFLSAPEFFQSFRTPIRQS